MFFSVIPKQFCVLNKQYMNYTISNHQVSKVKLPSALYRSSEKHSLLSKFMAWCERQESDRFLWLGLAFFLQIGMAVPLTAFSILFFGGNNPLLWIILVTVNVPTLVLNLAALPTKTTLPFLFFAWLTEITIILYCLGVALL